MRLRLALATGLATASLLITVGALGGCGRGLGSEPARAAPPAGWRASLRRDHPLVGRIVGTSEGRFVDADRMLDALARSRFVLFGEKHDNPDAHALQAAALAGLVARGRRPAVVFEMLSRERQEEIDAYLNGHPGDAAGLGEAAGWGRSGWPAYDLYRPIFDVAIAHGLPVVAGDLSRGDLALLRRTERPALGPADERRLGLDVEPPRAVRAALVDELRASHCGHGNDEMFARMVVAQWARDAQLATALVQAAARADGAVLIAGAGHVRSDRGVPMHLVRFAPAATAATVSFLEVVAGATDVRDYAEDGVLPFDYLYFTPRVDEDDPCAKFRLPGPR